MPHDFDPRARDFQRYGASLSRTLALGPALGSRIETTWVGGTTSIASAAHRQQLRQRVHGFRPRASATIPAWSSGARRAGPGAAGGSTALRTSHWCAIRASAMPCAGIRAWVRPSSRRGRFEHCCRSSGGTASKLSVLMAAGERRRCGLAPTGCFDSEITNRKSQITNHKWLPGCRINRP